MMKNLLAVALMSASVTAVAAGASTKETYAPGSGVTDRFSVATVFTYDVADDRADRDFIKNEFDFTLSSNVIVSVDEDTTDARYMTVAAGNTQGRNLFVGHSNGGSVSACGDALTSDEAKETDAVKNMFAANYLSTNENGCVADD